MRTEYTTDDLMRAVRHSGVREGDLINVKASLSEIGYVVGGAETLVDALVQAVGPSGTLVFDSFVKTFPLPLSKTDAARVVEHDAPTYAGAVAAAAIRHPMARRSLHPTQKFVAIGAKADELLDGHVAGAYAYDVLRKMAEVGGRNFKIGSDAKVVGVGTTHVAIGLLGLKQRLPRRGVNYRDGDGSVRFFERDWAGGCPRGFRKFDSIYEQEGAVLQVGRVGDAVTKLTDMATTLGIEMRLLTEDPRFLLCDDPDCVDCRTRWTFSDSGEFEFWMRRPRLVLQRVAKSGVGKALRVVAQKRGRASSKVVG